MCEIHEISFINCAIMEHAWLAEGYLFINTNGVSVKGLH